MFSEKMYPQRKCVPREMYPQRKCVPREMYPQSEPHPPPVLYLYYDCSVLVVCALCVSVIHRCLALQESLDSTQCKVEELTRDKKITLEAHESQIRELESQVPIVAGSVHVLYCRLECACSLL